MKKYISFLAVAVILFLFYFFSIPAGKNFYGNTFTPYGNCPNCEDSYHWKETQSIEIPGERYSAGLFLCEECMKSCKFDYTKIRKNLAKHQANATATEHQISRLKRYKAEKN
jgi:hypothetical protein